jgi:bifunctional DNA-binding transcriptional regulator/antitoxin component of YhaV-PrlF toxin-antitoxin module
MTVTLTTEITVPKSVRRKAGFKLGEQIEFKVADRAITIVPRLSPDEEPDEREVRDPRSALRSESYRDFVAGRSRPIEALFAGRAVPGVKRKSCNAKRPRRSQFERPPTTTGPTSCAKAIVISRPWKSGPRPFGCTTAAFAGKRRLLTWVDGAGVRSFFTRFVDFARLRSL